MDAGTSDDLKVDQSEVQADNPPPRMPILPTREDIDAVRNTHQFTPVEFRAYIDGLRFGLYGAGFSRKDVDDYYGIEHFDFDAAAKDLLTAAHNAAEAVSDPQILIDDITRSFQDPQKNTRLAKSAALEVGAGEMAGAFLENDAALAELPELIPVMLGATALSTARAVARQKLVEAQRAGTCSDPHDFRNGILEALADTGNLILPKKLDAWIEGAVRNVMTNPWTRERLADHIGMNGLTVTPRKTASAFLWALFDKDFHNAATAAWGRATELDKPDADRSAPPDWVRLGHTIRNMQDVYSRSGLTPDRVTAHAFDSKQLLRILASPQTEILKQSERMYLDREWSISGDPMNRDMFNALKLGTAIGLMSAGGLFGEELEPDEGVDGDSVEAPPSADDETNSIDDGAYAGAPQPETEIDSPDSVQVDPNNGHSVDTDAEDDTDEEVEPLKVYKGDGKLHDHHPYPMYMGGPKKQIRYPLPDYHHYEYHGIIYKHAPRDLDYENMDPVEKKWRFDNVLRETHKFDKKYGHDILGHMILNDFPGAEEWQEMFGMDEGEEMY